MEPQLFDKTFSELTVRDATKLTLGTFGVMFAAKFAVALINPQLKKFGKNLEARGKKLQAVS